MPNRTHVYVITNPSRSVLALSVALLLACAALSHTVSSFDTWLGDGIHQLQAHEGAYTAPSPPGLPMAPVVEHSLEFVGFVAPSAMQHLQIGPGTWATYARLLCTATSSPTGRSATTWPTPTPYLRA